MPMEGLIPIGGAKTSNSSSSRHGGASDLTSGLISISGARGNADVDMSDFDVGGLLDDAAPSSSRSKSSKATSEVISSSSSKKKDKSKSKSKSKSSSSSGKKKSKSKSKIKSPFDDLVDDDDDDASEWNQPTKNWDSTAELEMAAAAAARRKNAANKGGMGLDDEFAQMLGFDNGNGSGMGTGNAERDTFGSSPSPSISPEPVKASNPVDKDDAMGASSYIARVRGSQMSEAPSGDQDAAGTENVDAGGLSAAFFQDAGTGDAAAGESSFLSSLSGPRSERRGARRNPGSAVADPFALDTKSATTSSSFEALFGGSSSRRTARGDPFASSARSTAVEETATVSRLDQHENKTPVAADNEPSPTGAAPIVTRPATAVSSFSARDDLLADLFPTKIEGADSSQRARDHQESRSNESQDEASRQKPEPVTVFNTPSESSNPVKQQDDLLAKLFAKPAATTAHKDAESESRKPEPTVERKQELSDKPAVASEASRADGNVSNARESLLMDLLGDLSPPKPREPLLSRRKSRSNSNSSLSSSVDSPAKEQIDDADATKLSSPPSPTLVPVVETARVEEPTSPPRSTLPVATTEVISSVPEDPPSPGRARSLSTNNGMLVIRESDFEQSKDSLVEEILASAPSSPVPSPNRSLANSPQRRNSYSQSFEVEEDSGEQVEEVAEQKVVSVAEEPPATVTSSPPSRTSSSRTSSKKESETRPKPASEPTGVVESKATSECRCDHTKREEELAAKLTATFNLERATLQHQIDELQPQLEMHKTNVDQLTLQLQEQTTKAAQITLQFEAQTANVDQLTLQLQERASALAQLGDQLTSAQREILQAQQAASTSKDDAAGHQRRVEALETELRAVREELSRCKRSLQDAELEIARRRVEQEDVDQLERHREKRALEALVAQLQRSLAQLTLSQQVREEESGFGSSAARVAAEDESRLRVIASLEGSSKRAAQHAELERVKLEELLRSLEAATRSARQDAMEEKERLRQEQKRLDALSAHLQAQSAALREQEAVHATHMGQQLAETRQDARVYEARLAARRTQLERDERALYEARAEFAAFREQDALELDREREELRVSREKLEKRWRELRVDQEDLESELASHEDEFQALEAARRDVQEAEQRLAERAQQVTELAEKLDVGTRELLKREELVAQQASQLQEMDLNFERRERALERGKTDLEARERRLHAQIRQLDSARSRFTMQRREQQQLAAAARRHSVTTKAAMESVVDNNRPWRRETQSNAVSGFERDNNRQLSPPRGQYESPKSWKDGGSDPEDPSGLSPALRRQVEAHWQRREQFHAGRRRSDADHDFDLEDFRRLAAMEPNSVTKPPLHPHSTTGLGSKADARFDTTRVAGSRVFSPQKESKSASHTTQAETRKCSAPGPGNFGNPPLPRTPSFQPTLRVDL